MQETPPMPIKSDDDTFIDILASMSDEMLLESDNGPLTPISMPAEMLLESDKGPLSPINIRRDGNVPKLGKAFSNLRITDLVDLYQDFGDIPISQSAGEAFLSTPELF